MREWQRQAHARERTGKARTGVRADGCCRWARRVRCGAGGGGLLEIDDNVYDEEEADENLNDPAPARGLGGEADAKGHGRR